MNESLEAIPRPNKVDRLASAVGFSPPVSWRVI